MGYRNDDDLMADYCPKCSQYTGGDAICPNCGARIFDESGLEEVNEEEEGGGETINSDEEDDF